MQLEEIKKLAVLARIDMDDEELKGIAHDFDSILAYVGQVQEAIKLNDNYSNNLQSKPKLQNIMRPDVATLNPGEYADDIIKEMPDSDGRYLKVKRIL